MITFKRNTYTEKEIEALHNTLQSLNLDKTIPCKQDTRCRTCEYRHVCTDICSFIEYVEKLQQDYNK